jgi:fatty acid desaturase
MNTRQSSAQFLRQARSIINDLYRHNPVIYWADFLGSLTVGYAAAIAYLTLDVLAVQIVCFLIAGFALYRVSLFMHEIVHFRKGEMPFFSVAWNVLAGIPLLTPTFLYEPHREHHSSHHYGTDKDGEYLPLGNGPLSDIGFFMGQVFVQPIFVAFRFTVMTPISFLHPKIRQWVLERMSSFVIDWRFRREIPENAPRHWWAVMDVLCSIRAWMIFAAPLAGLAPWTRIPALYFLATFILFLNYLRTLAAHRYRSEGEPMSHVDQLLDSVDVTGDLVITELLCPVGLRYHALHHLFPSVPYHNLGIAHRRLMAQLPEDSPYRKVVEPSLWPVIWQIVRDAALRSRPSAAGHASGTHGDAEGVAASESETPRSGGAQNEEHAGKDTAQEPKTSALAVAGAKAAESEPNDSPAS